MSGKCDCNTKCKYCTQAAKTFIQKSTEFIKCVCCKNNGQIPKYSCTTGNCGIFNCGYKWVEKVLIELHPHSHDLSTCFIKYDQIECVEKTDKGRSIYGIKTYIDPWSKFVEDYVTKCKQYILHHACFIWQHQQKQLLLKSVPTDARFIHWDYINNPVVKYHHLTNDMWGEQKKFSLLIGVDTGHTANGANNSSIETETDAYYVKDTNHDWNMALDIVEKHIIATKERQYFQDNVPLNCIYNRSDRG